MKTFKLTLALLMLALTLTASEEIPTQKEVAKLYVATFNRAPDSAGLTWWTNSSNLTLSKIAQSFFDQPETKSSYPKGTSNREFIRSVYNNLFNREPDTAGWDYWETQLNNGAFSKNSFIMAVINGAQDNEDGMDKTILDNKTEVGLYFSLYGNNDTNLAKSSMSNITDEHYTVDDAKRTFYENSGNSDKDVCILDVLYFDKYTTTLCYEDVEKDICSGIQGSDYESDWYGFPVKGDCLELNYPKDSENFTEGGYLLYGMSGLYSDTHSPTGNNGDSDDDSDDNDNDDSGNSSGVKEITITKDNLVAQHEGAKITFSPMDIDGDKKLTIKRITPKPLPANKEIEDEYEVSVYDFKLDGITEFVDLIEIVLPYNESFIKATSDESASVIAMYYNPDTNDYESVDYEVDTDKNEVKILTNHLSEYAIFVLANGKRNGAFKIINANTKKAYITAVDAYYRFVPSSSATDIINTTVSNNMIEDVQAYEAGFNAANEWLGLMSAGNTLASAPFSSKFLTTLGYSFNHFGFGASVLQAAVDFGKGDNVALFTNLSKNVIYNMVNYADISALQLSFVGVFAIDYALNKFGTEALDGLEKKWKKIYDVCYEDGLAKTDDEWYKIFKKLREKSINPSKFSNVMEAVVYNNVYNGWKDESQMGVCAGVAGIGFNGLSSLTNEIQENISREKFYEIMKRLQPVFDRLEKDTVFKLRADYKKHLEDIKNNLNQIINVNIQETIEDGQTSKYAGYKFRFAPLNDKANKTEWSGVLDSKGISSTSWRILGYMQVGSPNKLELFKPKDNPDIDTPVKTIEFKTTPPDLTINIEDEEAVYAVFKWTNICYDPKGKPLNEEGSSEPDLLVLKITKTNITDINGATKFNGLISNLAVYLDVPFDSGDGYLNFTGTLSTGVAFTSNDNGYYCSGTYAGKYIDKSTAIELWEN
jgi:uncharacterized protein YsxB (DUF464 family)